MSRRLLVENSTHVFPPTPTPEAGQGPWCDLNAGRWWVVADGVADAFAAVASVDAEVFPIYFGWRATIEPVCIRWVAPEDWDEEHEIDETRDSDDRGAVEAWRITVEDA